MKYKIMSLLRIKSNIINLKRIKILKKKLQLAKFKIIKV